jgi:hypothetical protein
MSAIAETILPEKKHIDEWVEIIRQCDRDISKFERDRFNKQSSPFSGELQRVIYYSEKLKAGGGSIVRGLSLIFVPPEDNQTVQRQYIEQPVKVLLQIDYDRTKLKPEVLSDFATVFKGGQNFGAEIIINLSLHRKKRLIPLFLYLIEKYHIPKEVMDALWEISTPYRRFPPKEAEFYRTTLVELGRRISQRDLKYKQETLGLITQAERFDQWYNAWLKNQPDRHPKFSMVHLKRYPTSSEALYSLAEVYFQARAFEESLTVLNKIAVRDEFYYSAQLMIAQIKFLTYPDGVDAAAIERQRAVIVELKDDRFAPRLGIRLLEIYFGRTINEINTAINSIGKSLDEERKRATEKLEREKGVDAKLENDFRPVNSFARFTLEILNALDARFKTRGPLVFKSTMLEQMREFFPEKMYVVGLAKPSANPLTVGFDASRSLGRAWTKTNGQDVVAAEPPKYQ